MAASNTANFGRASAPGLFISRMRAGGARTRLPVLPPARRIPAGGAGA